MSGTKQGTKQGPKPKHIPQRTCIACRHVAGKRNLVRVVRTQTGVQVDLTGKVSGRGAYLHPYQKCWQSALEANRLKQALRTKLTHEDQQALFAFMSSLPASEESE